MKKAIVILLCFVLIFVMALSASAYIYIPSNINDYIYGHGNNVSDFINNYYENSPVDSNVKHQTTFIMNSSSNMGRIGYYITGLTPNVTYLIKWNFTGDIIFDEDTHYGGFCFERFANNNNDDYPDVTPSLGFGDNDVVIPPSSWLSTIDVATPPTVSPDDMYLPSILWCPGYSDGSRDFYRYVVKSKDDRFALLNGNDGNGLLFTATDSGNALLLFMDVIFKDGYTVNETDMTNVCKFLFNVSIESFSVHSLVYAYLPDVGTDDDTPTTGGGGDFNGGGAGGNIDDLSGANFLKWIGNALSGFFDTPLFLGVSMGDIVWYALGLSLLFVALKFFI